MRRQAFNPVDIQNYGVSEAVRWLHIPRQSMNYWLRGTKPIIEMADRHGRLFSFKNLVELYVIKGLTEIHGVRLPAIRQAVGYLLETWESKHPLADYELKTDGRHIFFWQGDEYLNMSLRGQKGFGPVLDSYLRRIDRDAFSVARVLHPFLILRDMKAEQDQNKVVSINPNVCFGMPVLSGSRITTAALASRYLGGDSVPLLARSYGRSEAEIEKAIRWELGKTKKIAA